MRWRDLLGPAALVIVAWLGSRRKPEPQPVPGPEPQPEPELVPEPQPVPVDPDLKGFIAVPEGPGVVVRSAKRAWMRADIAKEIEQAGAYLAQQGRFIKVGDASFKGGGPLPNGKGGFHKSHQKWVDVDISLDGWGSSNIDEEVLSFFSFKVGWSNIDHVHPRMKKDDVHITHAHLRWDEEEEK